MSDEEIKNLILRNMSPDKASISTETGLEAAGAIATVADAEAVEWALAGGLAMHLYGFLRATTDVDFIADGRLSITAVRQLSFGGERYTVEVGGRTIPVDWIVRRDDYRDFYRAALSDATVLPNGWRVVTPEWLAILKYIAGRGKDEIDLIWLLQQKGLVNRRTLREHLMKVLGRATAAIIYREIERRYMDLADSGREGDENESYRPLDEYPDYND